VAEGVRDEELGGLRQGIGSGGPWPRLRARLCAALLAGVPLALAPGATAAEPEPMAPADVSTGGAAQVPARAPAGAPGTPSPPAGPGIDRFLKLPNAVTDSYDLERRGGATRSEWLERFGRARDDLEDAEEAYDEAMERLEETAVGANNWRFVPPGGDVGGENHDNIRLRREVAKRREERERAEKQLLELEIQANLHAVPEDWRAEPPRAGAAPTD